MKTAFLLATFAALMPGASLRNTNGLEVHEWGTFTSVAGSDGMPMQWNTLGCKSDLPAFVEDNGLRNLKRISTETIRMETPVIYFYSPIALTANVSVRFPVGTLTEWYPHARGKSGSGLEWNDVKVQPGTSPEFRTNGLANAYYAARATDAAPLEVDGEHEKFLFYRGIGTFPVPILARASSDGSTSLTNIGDTPVAGVLLVDNHQGRIRYQMVGELRDSLTLGTAYRDTTATELRTIVERELMTQGLYPREASAMLATWHNSWFEEGTRAIYIVPSKTVNEILPLTIQPSPERVARVFVGRIELVSEATKQTVAAAAAKQDWAAIGTYRRFLNPILTRMYPDGARMASEIMTQVPCR